ncbi:MAG: hypothetical protein HYR85_20310 [Planctomycetes bacterium]|nr:hypothetical protein [Planctomycetota bacterium]MBI3847412.1 hypothetical protein [Planctomycetota bacterium]
MSSSPPATRVRVALACGWLLALVGCAAGTRLPDRVVAAAHATAPGGSVRIEVDEQGETTAVVAEIPLAQAPQGAKDSVERERPGGRIVRCERWWSGDSTGFTIAKVILALEQIVVMDETGRVVRTESEIAVARAPQIILDSGNAVAPGGSIRKVLEVRAGDRLEYRISKRIGDQSLILLISSGGEVRAVVREVPAVIEVPNATHAP